MTDKETLDKLWEAHRDRPFASFSLQRTLKLRRDDMKDALCLISDMADSGEVRSEYQIKRVASTIYKMTQSTQNDSDSLKGLPLPPPKESLTGANTALLPSTDPENAENGINDPFPKVPAELKARQQWVNWVSSERDGKPTKIPIKPPYHEGDRIIARGASTDKPATWRTYQQALDVHERYANATIYTWKKEGDDWQQVTGEYGGIGFVFSEDDPYCGIDLDDCLDAHGNLKEWAKPIVDRLKAIAYGEKSPSGNGIKFWTRAALPPVSKHKAYLVEDADAIEIYDQVRYFTVTGQGKGHIGEGQADIDWLVEAYFTPQSTEATTQLPRSAPTNNLKADEVIALIRTSRQAAKFDKLMQGVIDPKDHGSQSEADLGLCGVIAFWTQDSAVIDAIFRSSRLMRTKWDERHKGDGATYGQMTITEALSELRETYTPPKGKPASKSKRRLNRSKQLYGRKR